MICSQAKLDDEIKFITMALCNNTYLLVIVQSVFDSKISDFNKIKPASLQICAVYLRLPWLDNISDESL